ncbi:hypothetical protein [Piscinibacter sp.]|uniref:hypothetical protein n=1 Tax=Piscinibacter sp. TaxID=1903157 RepID=UPI0039E308F3
MILTVGQVLDLARARTKSPSDYALSKLLKAFPSALTNYRSGRSFPDDLRAIRLADLAGLDRAYVLACMWSWRTPEGAVREEWRAMALRLRSQPFASAACTAQAAPGVHEPAPTPPLPGLVVAMPVSALEGLTLPPAPMSRACPERPLRWWERLIQAGLQNQERRAQERPL